MVLKVLALVVGVLELLVPRQLVDFWMNLASADDDVELRSWVYTAARIEGVVLVLWALKGCCSRSDE
ncbi:hypothetical protein [Halobellus salinisoli]|uniref:hypothetical protein n=1 Tax=Halobellus salinisoli TaxID=3108500 RepID=UPI0030086795